MKGPKAWLTLITGQVRLEKTGAMSHLQKFSPFGFMFTWPFCFHFWLFWHKQEQVIEPGFDDPKWIPGSERGIYFRTPGWRYDTDYSDWLHWTWGYFGGHWD